MTNILLLVVDCLRADHLSCYGYDKRTPNIDNLASEGTLYENAWSGGSYTAVSIPFILSEYLYLQLTRKGYTIPTVIHSNPLVTRYLKNNKRGYFNIDLHPKHTYSRIRNLWGILWNGVYRGEGRADTINTQALRVMKELGTPFFMCLWYMDVHSPFFPPYKTEIKDILLNRKYLKAATNKTTDIGKKDLSRLIENYDGEISYFDSTLWKLLREIPEDTIIILTADHGEEFLEHGSIGHHDKEIKELRHVPLILKIPNTLPGIVSEPFHHRELDSLILDLTSKEDGQ